MPELPEVETVARHLDAPLRGERLEAIEILDSKLVLGAAPPLGSRVERVFRRGKLVVIELARAAERGQTKRSFLAVHLRMTGRLIHNPAGGPPTPAGESPNDGAKRRAGAQAAFVHDAPQERRHLRALLRFGHATVEFYDARRFGTMTLYESLEAIPLRGVEPLSGELTVERLSELLKKARQPVKPWLLRQDRIVGIGNIYASEILFRAGIGPRRRASALRAAEIARLQRAIIEILELAVASAGTTFSDFQRPDGETGGFQSFLCVYEREDEPCSRCGARIKRFVQAQRSTYFCPSCQGGASSSARKRARVDSEA